MENNKNVNVVSCPPCGENVALATKRGLSNKETSFTTPHRPYGALPPQVGKLTAHGFTLIELLVVVLIIGILAAVAVPQYKIAVAKSRTATFLPIVKALTEAQERYYLENGQYAEVFNELDVDVPAGCTTVADEEYELFKCDPHFLIMYDPNKSINASYCPYSNTDLNTCLDVRDFFLNFKLLYHDTQPDHGGARRCTVKNSSKLGKAVCSTLAGFECRGC